MSLIFPLQNGSAWYVVQLATHNRLSGTTTRAEIVCTCTSKETAQEIIDALRKAEAVGE